MPKAPSYSVSAEQTGRAIRTSDYGARYLQGVTVAKDNGTTGFGQVLAGTPMGRITATGKYRPCAKQAISQGATAAALPVSDAACFYVGDAVDVISTLGVVGSVNLVASAGDDTIEVVGRSRDGLAHTVALADPGANDAALGQTVTRAANGVATIQISLATGGDGSISSTVVQVIAELNRGEAGSLVYASLADGDDGTATTTAVDAAALAGGLAPGGTLLTNSTVSAVAKAANPNTVTVGSQITVVSGDVIRARDGSQTARGILDKTQSTYDRHASDLAQSAVYADVSAEIGWVGRYRQSLLPGYDSSLLVDLAGVDLGDDIRI
ncbi:MAG: hypothetical protein Q8R92_21050 [Deltaproteobacteria bacterium]|nr:hypothetical protein [Deltaproteobacteria bacterium]